MKTYSAARVILTAGLICGFLDGLSAVAIAAYSGVGAMRVFQGIASGLLGHASFQGGVGTAVLGVLFHFMVATGAAAVYFFASRSLPVMIDRALVCGVVFGILVHLFMTFVTIPLSAIGRRHFVLQSFVTYLFGRHDCDRTFDSPHHQKFFTIFKMGPLLRPRQGNR